VPKVLGILAAIDPLSYGVDGLRRTLIGVSHFGGMVDLAVLSVLSLVCMVFGARMFSRIQL
jgi:ABC-2 type transport system permease protein